jgi:hypothetical protein
MKTISFCWRVTRFAWSAAKLDTVQISVKITVKITVNVTYSQTLSQALLLKLLVMLVEHWLGSADPF